MTAAPAGGTPPVPPAGLAGGSQRWVVLTASERGASHVAVKSPNQDAVGTERAGASGVVAAVADGHGHSRHLRSARGSRLAVKIGCQVAQEFADRIESDPALLSQQTPDGAVGGPAGEIARLADEVLVPGVVRRWRDAVLADVQADPFSEAEQDLRHPGDDAVIAYGSTLLLCIALRDWLILAQIGDGDVVGVRADGRSVLPVPTDPQLDGLVTTSLCGADPRSDFRCAVVDLAHQPLVALLLATDGYGNAQMVEQWPGAFSKDLAWMLAERDLQWLAGQLPAWAARCASSDGSADDTTVALLVSSAATSSRAGRRDEGSEETTIPAVPHAATVPVDRPAELHSIEPVTMRQLAHRAAPEPVILERATARQTKHGPDITELASQEPETTELVSYQPAPAEPAGREPATNEIPKLRQGHGQDGDGQHGDEGPDQGSGAR